MPIDTSMDFNAWVAELDDYDSDDARRTGIMVLDCTGEMTSEMATRLYEHYGITPH